MRVDGAERQIFRHTLDEPERQRVGSGFAGSITRPGADIELECVHELVANHMVGVGQRTTEWQDDATPKRFREPTRPFADFSGGGVGLLEIRMRRVEHERLPAAQAMSKQPLEPSQPALGETRRQLGAFELAWIEVDVKVL